MNPNPHNPMFRQPRGGTGEETLRLIASLPAPAGLEDRVHAALRSTPRHARVLSWPKVHRPGSAWIRTAAAAAIAFVVAGGGWGVYTHVQHGQPAKVIVMPPRMPAAGGFSSAGAMRTPQTLPGPVVAQPAKVHPAQPKATKKPAPRPEPIGTGTGQPNTTAKAAGQPGAPK